MAHRSRRPRPRCNQLQNTERGARRLLRTQPIPKASRAAPSVIERSFEVMIAIPQSLMGGSKLLLALGGHVTEGASK